MQKHKKYSDPLRIIPGIGESIADDLRDIGIRSVADLKGKDPQKLYELSNQHAGSVQDRCLLYTFRCAVYYASHTKHDPEKLKWWNWQDRRAAALRRLPAKPRHRVSGRKI
jgi:hypothetical protein